MQPTDRGPTSDSWLLTAAPTTVVFEVGQGYYYQEGKVLFLHRTALTNAALAKLQRHWRER